MSVLISCEVGGTCMAASPAEGSGDGSTEGASSTVTAPRRRKSAAKTIPTVECDAPALYVARRMSRQLTAPLIVNEYSMALIDVTRSLHHRALFPPGTRSWPADDRQRLIDQIHAPYRQQIRAGIESLFSTQSYVIHLSIRSFPLRQSGKIRRTDTGLLYDPSRDEEVDLCLDWIDEMYDVIPMLRVRRNYPRRGTTDSITRSMRSEFSDLSYLGVEVLVNRAWAGRPLAIRDETIDQMCVCLQRVIAWPQSEAA